MENLSRIRAAERLHEGGHCRHVTGIDGRIRLDGPGFQALAERSHVLASRAQGNRHPTDGQHQGQNADVGGGEELQGHQNEDRGRALGEALDEDIDEGLGLDP